VSQSKAVLRDAHWLTEDRVAAFARVLLFLLLGCGAISVSAMPAMQVGHDFGAFWTAARLALEGRAKDAYGEPEQAALAALFGPGRYPPFFYPPVALLLWIPFALIPFAASAALWVVGTSAAYAAAVRTVLKGRSIVAIIAFPAVAVCALFGQNSLFSTAILAGAATTLDRYPIVAGVLIGVLAYKPQLAILAPLVLMSARRWTAFAAAAGTTCLLVGGATAVFGVGAWKGFFDVLPEASAWNFGAAPGLDIFVSPLAAVRQIGGSTNLAWFVQILTAAAAIATLVIVSRKRPGGAAEMALMVACTGLCVPSLGIYDMVIFAVPGAWLISEAVTSGWLPFERVTLAALYMTPFAMVLAGAKDVPLAPAAMVALVGLLVRRIQRGSSISRVPATVPLRETF